MSEQTAPQSGPAGDQGQPQTTSTGATSTGFCEKHEEVIWRIWAVLKTLWASILLGIAAALGISLVLLGFGVFPWNIASVVPWTVPSHTDSNSISSTAPSTKQTAAPAIPANSAHPTAAQIVEVTIPDDPAHPTAAQNRTYDVQIPDAVIDRLGPNAT